MFKTLRSKILFVLIAMIVVSAVPTMIFVERKITSILVELENQNARNLLKTVALNVESEYKSILFHKKHTLENRKNKLKEINRIAINAIDEYYLLFMNNKLTEQEAKKLAIEKVQKIRYDNGAGYVWINDTVLPYPNIIMHPTNPEFNLKRINESDFKAFSLNSKNLLKTAVEKCLKDGEGYINYLWPKPTKNGLTAKQRKLSYINYYKKWNWIIGTGLYIDDIEQNAKERLEAVLDELRLTLSKLRIAENGYIFIFTGDRKMLIHPRLEKVDFYNYKNPITKNLILEDIKKVVKQSSGYLDYRWEKIESEGKFTFWKRVFVSYFEPLDWYIASSVYLNDIETRSKSVVKDIFYITIILFSLASLVAFLLSRNMAKPLQELAKAAKKIKFSGSKNTPIPISGTSETKELGLILDEMINSIEFSVKEKQNLLKKLESSNKDLIETNLKLAEEIIERKHIENELRKSNDKYQSIVENSTDTIMLTNPKGKISYISPACKHVLGYYPNELNNSLISICHPEDVKIMRSIYKDALKGKTGANVEIRIITSENKIKWISYSWAPIIQNQIIYMVVSIIRDITEQKSMQEDLINAKKLESIGILAAGIAHDFNNLLMAVIGNIMLTMQDIDKNSPPAETLKNAEKAARLAIDLSKQMSSFAKGENPIKNIISLKQIIIDTVKITTKGSNIQCDFEFDDNLFEIEANKTQIIRVINNLILNSMQAMNNQGVIKISCKNSKISKRTKLPLNKGKYIKISIEDTGTGIKPENIQKIFDPYFSTKEKNSVKGTGLGLTTSYSIIKRHNGFITVQSELNKGTIFDIFLPALEKQATTSKG